MMIFETIDSNPRINTSLFSDFNDFCREISLNLAKQAPSLDRKPPAVILRYSHIVLTIYFSIYIYFSGSEATPRTTDGDAWTS